MSGWGKQMLPALLNAATDVLVKTTEMLVLAYL